MRRSVFLIGGAALGLVAVAALVACGGGGESKPPATVIATSAPEVTATNTSVPSTLTETPLSLGFGCPTQWQKYACPSASGRAGVLTLPYPAGAEAEVMCQNVQFYTSGVVNNVSMLYRLPPNTEIVAPVDGQVTGVGSSPAPHEYTKSIALDAKQFLIQIYFVGEPKVSANATGARGDVLGVITGTFPTDSLPDSKLYGASMVINIVGLDSRMLDASDPELWAGGVPSCYAP
jgi:hypothetical protein